jgi:hypothetical protein
VNDWRATAIDSIAAEGGDTGVLWPEERQLEPRLVENVLMPIPEAEQKQEDANTKDGKPRNVNFMLASLASHLCAALRRGHGAMVRRRGD